MMIIILLLLIKSLKVIMIVIRTLALFHTAVRLDCIVSFSHLSTPQAFAQQHMQEQRAIALVQVFQTRKHLNQGQEKEGYSSVPAHQDPFLKWTHWQACKNASKCQRIPLSLGS